MTDIGDIWVMNGKNVILPAGPFETSLKLQLYTRCHVPECSVVQATVSLFVPSYAMELSFQYS
jgi:hypothetical protein